MQKISYSFLEEMQYDGYLLKEAPERVLQFGEGNFLRAFVDYFIDVMNEKAEFNSKVILVQPIMGGDFIRERINEQEGLYTLILRGNENGKKINEKRVISCVSRCINPYLEYDTVMECANNPELRYIVCNTTEAGIRYDEKCRLDDRPAESFPAKLTQFLYKRYKNMLGGFIILSCELIDDNGKELKKCVLKYAGKWGLEESFIKWIEDENIFCSTLVDRIVTGYPKNEADMICEELGYEDAILDTGEIFASWVIEGPESLKNELPFEKCGLPIMITDNHKPYKERKVRILNGAHTSMVLGAFLAGKNIVRECIQDEIICKFMEKIIYDEVIPFLTLCKPELNEFAQTVSERFSNPYIEHELLAISLNSTAKWKARVLPSLKAYVGGDKKIPQCIAASLAFYIKFYRVYRKLGEEYWGINDGKKYRICDEKNVLNFFYENRDLKIDELVDKVLKNEELWDEDLSKMDGLYEMVIGYLRIIEEKGCYEVMRQCI